MATGNQKSVSHTLPKQMIMRLDEASASEGITRSELIRHILWEWLENYDPEATKEKLVKQAQEMARESGDFDDEEIAALKEKSIPYLTGVIEQLKEFDERFGKESKDDSPKNQYVKDKQKKLQTKYQRNFDLATKVIENSRQLKEDGVIPQDLDTSNEVQVKRWLLAHKKELNDSRIRRLG